MKSVAAALIFTGTVLAGGHGHGFRRGGYVIARPTVVVRPRVAVVRPRVALIRPTVATYSTLPLASSSTTTGAYVTGSYTTLPTTSSTATYVSGGYATGRMEAASSASSMAGYTSYSNVQSPVEVQQFVSNNGPSYQTERNVISRKQKLEITHRPVFHKDVVNHVTMHDTVAKTVNHHIGETENRFLNVAGKNVHGGSVSVDHGKVGHASYGAIVAGYQSGARRLSAVAFSAVAPMATSAGSQFRWTAGTYETAPLVETKVEQFINNDGPTYESQKLLVNRKKQIQVTHHPVYHKTIVNHKTLHDTEKKDVYHHIGETKNRFEDATGKTTSAPREDIDHGKVGHAAYGSIVDKFRPKPVVQGPPSFEQAK